MRATQETGRTDGRARLALVGLAVTLIVAGIAAAVTVPAWAESRHQSTAESPPAGADRTSRPDLSRLDLNGYVIDVTYTAGRNTGNTFRQDYRHAMVRGSAIAGPWAGAQSTPQDYVALRTGTHELYVTWLDPATHAISEALLLNLAHRTVYDFAPGGDTPESAGTFTVTTRGATALP